MTRRQGLLALEDWLTAVEASDQPELRSFANGIRRDQQAVTAGLALPYSSGTMEGNVNKIKMIKRQMYGRAASRYCASASYFTLRNPHHKIRARAIIPDRSLVGLRRLLRSCADASATPPSRPPRSTLCSPTRLRH